MAAHTTYDARIWHYAYSHLGYDNMKRLVKENRVKGLPETVHKIEEEKQRVCEPCIKGKQPCQPSKSRTKYSRFEVGEKIHTEVCGPMEEESVGGARYFVSFIDEASQYSD